MFVLVRPRVTGNLVSSCIQFATPIPSHSRCKAVIQIADKCPVDTEGTLQSAAVEMWCYQCIVFLNTVIERQTDGTLTVVTVLCHAHLYRFLFLSLAGYGSQYC